MRLLATIATHIIMVGMILIVLTATACLAWYLFAPEGRWPGIDAMVRAIAPTAVTIAACIAASVLTPRK